MKTYTKTEFEKALQEYMGFEKVCPDFLNPENYCFVKKLDHSKFKNLTATINLTDNCIEMRCNDLGESNIGEVCIIKEQLPNDYSLELQAIENLLQIFIRS